MSNYPDEVYREALLEIVEILLKGNLNRREQEILKIADIAIASEILLLKS